MRARPGRQNRAIISRLSRPAVRLRIQRQEDDMRNVLSVLLVVGFVNQGIARAQEVSRGERVEDVAIVPDAAALARSIERLSAGDRIVVATEEGAVDGEFVEQSDGDLVVDRLLLEGGAERLAIPLAEVQGVRFAPPPGGQRANARTATMVVAVASAVAAVLLLRWLFFTPRP
jgi:hypothetical protein